MSPRTGGRQWLFGLVFVVVGIAALGLFAWRLPALLAIGSGGGLHFVDLLATAAGCLLAAELGLFVWLWPQVARIRSLRVMFPQALVFGAQVADDETPIRINERDVDPDTGSKLAHALGQDWSMARSLGTYCAVVVDERGVGFWKGRRTPSLAYQFPWSDIGDIGNGSANFARPLPVVSIGVDTEQWKGSVLLAPCREGWLAGWAELSPRVARGLMREIRSARPGAESA